MPSCDLFRPSDYTGLMMHALRAGVSGYRRGSGLDMGVGSGVLLATLGELGVQRLVGVDIEQAALRSAAALLRAMHLLERARLLRGSLWEPVGAARFDIVVANLPHFAATEPSDPDRSPYWSMGGADERHLLDPFLAGLAMHLADDGVALITHNAFVGVDRTEAILMEQGLVSRGVLATTVPLHPAKTALLKAAVRARFTGARDQPAGTVRVRRCADTRDPAGVVSVVSQWPTGPGPATTVSRRIRILSAMILLFALLSPARAGESRAMLAAQQILDQARTSATDCTRASEALVSILCAKQLRVGLRSYYPGFSVRDDTNTFSGFEVDIAGRIADFLGVRLVPVAVDTKTRIPLVSDGDIDLVIATMSAQRAA